MVIGMEFLQKLAEQAGVTGTILALALLAIWYIDRERKRDLAIKDKMLQEVQNKRVADAQAMVDKLLSLNDKWNETLQTQLQAGAESTKVLMDVRDRVDELGQRVDDLYEEARR